MKIPVIFLSKTIRTSPEIELIVKQACKNNKDVYLLGDDGNKPYCPNNHVSMFDYYEGASEFEKLYRHLSTNEITVELFCFSRWFIMRDFLRKNNFDGGLHLDTDILFFSDATKEFNRFKHLYCVLSGRTSGHSSYWTLEGLEAFCDYLMEIYSNPSGYDFQRLEMHYQVRQHFGLDGGLCDMTLLESFARYKYPHLVGECSVVSDGSYYDHIIQIDEGFEFEDGRKRFYFENGVPYSHHIRSNRDIPFSTIHFQGASKYLINDFFQDCDDSII